MAVTTCKSQNKGQGGLNTVALSAKRKCTKTLCLVLKLAGQEAKRSDSEWPQFYNVPLISSEMNNWEQNEEEQTRSASGLPSLVLSFLLGPVCDDFWLCLHYLLAVMRTGTASCYTLYKHTNMQALWSCKAWEEQLLPSWLFVQLLLVGMNMPSFSLCQPSPCLLLF